MSQKPIVMEQLKQILQLKNDGIGIREIARVPRKGVAAVWRVAKLFLL